MSEKHGVTNQKGRWIEVDPADLRGRELIRAGGDFNPNSLHMWQLLLQARDWDAVIDVGANYGEMLLGVDLPEGSAVVAYEPNGKIADYLQSNLRSAGTVVDVRRSAVSDRRGTVNLIVDEEWSGKSRVEDVGVAGIDGGFHRTEVPVVTIDQDLMPLAGQRVAMKIDVEGHEEEVLAGAHRFLGLCPEFACLVEILHMPRERIALLTEQYDFYLLDLVARRFTRIAPCEVTHMSAVLDSGVFYPQDAVLTRPSLVEMGVSK